MLLQLLVEILTGDEDFFWFACEIGEKLRIRPQDLSAKIKNGYRDLRQYQGCVIFFFLAVPRAKVSMYRRQATGLIRIKNFARWLPQLKNRE